MSSRADKVMGIVEAIDRFVKNESHISIGGFTINRNPMAAVYEIIRQKKKDLHLYAHSNGQGVDELVGAGCVSRLEIAYGGSGRFAPTCVRFRKAVESGRVKVEDYSNYQMTLRFMAGAMGVPFLPTRSALGTDIIAKWGFAGSIRKRDPKLPDKKLVVLDNPFGTWSETPKVVLVPAIRPDVTVLHVQQCDPQGTCRIAGLAFADVEQARAAEKVIVTCERLTDTETMRRAPDRNQIPFFSVDAVVPIPGGAYPTACYGYYDYDPDYLNRYRKTARNEAGYQIYLKEYVYDMPDHAGLIAKIGKERFNRLKANPRTGYATGLDRQ